MRITSYTHGRMCWRHQAHLFWAAWSTLLDLTGKWYPIFAARVINDARQCPRCHRRNRAGVSDE